MATSDEVRSAAERVLDAQNYYGTDRVEPLVMADLADVRTVARYALAAAERVERLETILEQIHGNIEGLGDGKQPNITEPARFYFRIVERLCVTAFAAQDTPR